VNSQPPPFSTRCRMAFLASFFLFSTIGFFGPMIIYVTNTMEFSFVFRQAFWILLLFLAGGVTAGTAFLMLMPVRGKVFDRSIALACALGTALWLQGNVMVWRYGFVDGRDIDWSSKALFGWIDTPIWILLLGSALFFYRQWVKNSARLCAILLVVQTVTTLPHLLRMGEEHSFKSFSASKNGQFQFSKGTNIIVLVVDTLQSDVFQEILEEDSSVASVLDGFTYFKNAVGGFPTTYGAISFILTGQYYENQEPFQHFLKKAFLSDCSVPNALLQHGVRVELFPLAEKTMYFSPHTLSNLAPPVGVTTRDVAYLYGLTLFRYAPHFLKSRIHHAREWVVTPKRPAPERAQETTASSPPPPAVNSVSQPDRLFPNEAFQFADIRFASDMHRQANSDRDGTLFKFIHRMGAHSPIVLNENLEYGPRPFNRENYKGFVIATFKWVGVVLDTLKRINAYDNSLIFILGDHGNSQLGLGLRMPHGQPATPSDNDSLENIVVSGIPLILVKPMGSTGPLHARTSPVTLGDVPATIFASLGIDRACNGIPLFDVPEDAPRSRRYLFYRWTHSSWKNEYFPVITEYEVNGFSWDISSWRLIGQQFSPPGNNP
jgi:hypothetical protein